MRCKWFNPNVWSSSWHHWKHWINNKVKGEKLKTNSKGGKKKVCGVLRYPRRYKCIIFVCPTVPHLVKAGCSQGNFDHLEKLPKAKRNRCSNGKENNLAIYSERALRMKYPSGPWLRQQRTRGRILRRVINALWPSEEHHYSNDHICLVLVMLIDWGNRKLISPLLLIASSLQSSFLGPMFNNCERPYEIHSSSKITS